MRLAAVVTRLPLFSPASVTCGYIGAYTLQTCEKRDACEIATEVSCASIFRFAFSVVWLADGGIHVEAVDRGFAVHRRVFDTVWPSVWTTVVASGDAHSSPASPGLQSHTVFAGINSAWAGEYAVREEQHQCGQAGAGEESSTRRPVMGVGRHRLPAASTPGVARFARRATVLSVRSHRTARPRSGAGARCRRGCPRSRRCRETPRRAARARKRARPAATVGLRSGLSRTSASMMRATHVSCRGLSRAQRSR